MKNLYEILNIDKNASDGEIKKNYRKLAFKYHKNNNEIPTEPIYIRQPRIGR